MTVTPVNQALINDAIEEFYSYDALQRSSAENNSRILAKKWFGMSDVDFLDEIDYEVEAGRHQSHQVVCFRVGNVLLNYVSAKGGYFRSVRKSEHGCGGTEIGRYIHSKRDLGRELFAPFYEKPYCTRCGEWTKEV